MEGNELVVSIVAIVFAYKLISMFMKQYFGTRNKKEDDGELFEMNKRSLELIERIEKLESILDKDLPGWRNRI